MPKASTKKSKKVAKSPGEMPPENDIVETGAVATAVAEPETPAEAKAPAPEPPSAPAEPTNGAKSGNSGPQNGKKDGDKKGPEAKDHMANSINIAKLQAMSMTD